MVLLGVLAIVLSGFLVDMFWMYDSVKAASDRLQKAADEMAQRPNENGKAQFLSREGVATAIGFQPTTSKVENGRLIEQYRWWGSLPLPRRFIEVIYSDPDGSQYDKYEISNRDIFGNDVDPDEVNKEQPPATPADAGGTATDPSQTPSPPMPTGITGPPTPSGNEPAGKEESSPDESKESPPATDSTDEPPAKTEDSKE